MEGNEVAKWSVPRRKLAQQVAAIAAKDARKAVARESDAGILEPRYTVEALKEMGMARSYGESIVYRVAFTMVFVEAWQDRFAVLTEPPALAQAQDGHATVQPWQAAGVVFDNGKEPRVPQGWWPADAQTASDPKGGR